MVLQPIFIPPPHYATPTIFYSSTGVAHQHFSLEHGGGTPNILPSRPGEVVPNLITNNPIFYYHKIPQNSIILKNQYIFTFFLYKIQVIIPKFIVYCIIYNFQILYNFNNQKIIISKNH
jgi:hypothetical protein